MAENTRVVPAPPATEILPPKQTAKTFLYKLELIHSLPLLNLRCMPSVYLLTCNSNIRFLRWLKRKYRLMSYLYRLGVVLTLIVVAAPRHVSVVLVIPAMVCSMAALFCTIATLSLDMVRSVMQQYEFWFFSGMNVVNWLLLAYFLCDFRRLGLLAPCLAVEFRIFMDANFRMLVSHVKNCCLAEIPMLLVIMGIVAMQLLNTRVRANRKVNLALVDLVLNAHMTVIVFTIRKAYNKRKLLSARNAGCKSVQCIIFRVRLILRRCAIVTIGVNDNWPPQTRRGTQATKELPNEPPPIDLAGGLATQRDRHAENRPAILVNRLQGVGGNARARSSASAASELLAKVTSRMKSQPGPRLEKLAVSSCRSLSK
uniref:Uncharacterized protein n=1 Tax=Globisporangium ultimum (strain ATCC 200006 / CBS 805.95 / DAOM BR144) TaxID=431595 RepID=K3WJI0_GLOUD